MAKKRKRSNTYKHPGLKRGYAVNWNANIIYKTKKWKKKGSAW